MQSCPHGNSRGVGKTNMKPFFFFFFLSTIKKYGKFCEEKEHSSLNVNKTGICSRFGNQRKSLWVSSSKAEIKEYMKASQMKKLGLFKKDYFK